MSYGVWLSQVAFAFVAWHNPPLEELKVILRGLGLVVNCMS